MLHADCGPAVGLPEPDPLGIARRVLVDTANRYGRIEQQRRTAPRAGDRQRGAGFLQAMAVDEIENIEVCVPHGFGNGAGLRLRGRLEVCDVRGLDHQVLDLEIAEIDAWQALCQRLQVREARFIVPGYHAAEQ